MGGTIVNLKDIQLDEPHTNLPRFDVALPRGANPDEEARKIVKNGVVPVSAVKFDSPTKREAGESLAGRSGRSLLQLPRAIAETAGFLGSAAIGAAGGALSKIYTQALTGDVEAGKAVGEGVARAITFDPNNPELAPHTTELGKELSGKIGRFMSIPAEIGRESVNLPLESWGAPESTAEPIRTAAEFAAYGGIKPGAKIARSAAKNNIVASTVRGARNAADFRGVSDVLGSERPVIVPLEKVAFDKPTSARGEAAPFIKPVKDIVFDEPEAPPIDATQADALKAAIAAQEAEKPAVAQVVQPAEAIKPVETVGGSGIITFTGRVFHGGDMAENAPFRGLGVHATGDINVAKSMSETGNVQSFALNNAKFLKVRDHGGRHDNALFTVREFVKDGVLPKEWLNGLEERLVGDQSGWESRNLAELSRVRDFLRGKGYDGLIYENVAEGGNKPSIVMFDRPPKETVEAPPPAEIVEPGATSKAVAGKVEPGPAAPIAEGETGIKNAVTEAERAARGLEEVEVEARRSFGTAFDEGKRLVDSGEKDPRALAREMADNPRALNAEESAMLIYDRMKLQNEHKAAMDSIEKALKDGDSAAETEARRKLSILEEDINTNDVAARRTGYEQGMGLAARRMMVKQDYSLSAMLQRARIDNGGKPVTPEMRTKYEELAKKIEDASAKLAEYEAKIAEREAAMSLDKIKADVAKEQRQTRRAVKKEELAAEFTGLVKELNEALSGLHAGVDPTAALILGKMAKNRVKSGIVTVEGLVDHIYTEVKKAGIDLSRRDIRDAISGYGVTAHMSKDAINVQLRELKRQMRLISALEDAKAGKAPLRSGLQRDAASDAVRALERQVHQAMRESGVRIKTPEEQWKTSLDAVKTRLKHQIADLVKRMETGEAEAKKTGIKYDADATALRNLRNKVQAVLDFAEGKTGKRELSPEQRIRMATAAVERSIKEYERRITEEDLKPKKRTSTTPETPELKALHKERDLLKEIYKTMADEAKPKKSPEEIALKSFKTRTANRIAELETKMKAGDFSKKQKKRTALDKEALYLQYRLDQAKRAYHEARFRNQLANRNVLQKVGAGFMEAANLLRAMKTSFDLSAVLRQGGFISFGHPLRSRKSIPDMLRAVSNMGEFAVKQEIMNRPNYPLYQKSGLYLADHGGKLSQMEEVYMSRWADKIPGVAASQRTYTTFLNRLRADSFDAMMKGLTKNGRTASPKEMNAISNYINVATGRGNLGHMENTLVGLNVAFFAPRYVASRFQLVLGQPLWRGTARTRIMIAKEYARFLAGLGTVYALGMAAGAEVETDPRSSDFGKIKFGNTRIDPLAGISQTTVLLSRLATGETKTSSGKIVPIRGDNVPYGKSNSADVIARFLRTKLAPVPGLAVDVLAGKDVVGQKVTLESIPERTMVPLAFNDIYAAMKENGVPAGSALGILSIFGMGLQVYDPQNRNNETIFDVIRQDFLGEEPENSSIGRARERRRTR